MTRATVVLSEGQFMDIPFESRSDVLEREYMEMIYRKTGALFQAAGEMGAIMGGGNDRSIGLLATYGQNMGISFQIYDDYLGMTSSEDVLGKTVGNDVREGKKTLIVIKGLATPARGQLLSLLGRQDATKSEIRSLIAALRKQGVLESTYGMAKEYIARAKEAVEQLPPSPSRGTLVELADYAISRRK